MEEEQGEYVTAREAAQILRVSAVQVTALLNRGLLHPFKRKADLRFTWFLRSEVEALNEMFPDEEPFKLVRKENVAS